MRSSRDIEGGSCGVCATRKALGEHGGRERERVKIVCTRTYISVVPGSEGCSCIHGDTLTHRTGTTDAGRRWELGGKSLEAFLAACDLLFRIKGAGDCDPCNDLGNVL